MEQRITVDGMRLRMSGGVPFKTGEGAGDATAVSPM
jgi:hypothetical protein